jgi:hypothetical protein
MQVAHVANSNSTVVEDVTVLDVCAVCSGTERTDPSWVLTLCTPNVSAVKDGKVSISTGQLLHTR